MENNFTLLDSIITKEDLNNQIVFDHNILKFANSKAVIEEYSYVIANNTQHGHRIGLYSFCLPEYRSFTGNEMETFEVRLQTEINVNTRVHIQHGLMNVVYHCAGNKFIEIIGKEEAIAKYKDLHLKSPYKFLAQRLKTFFSVPILTPVFDDDISNVVARKYLFRVAAMVLNKFSDDFRSVTGMPWISMPHYSYSSFGEGILREFDEKGGLLHTNKFLLNPSRIHPSELPRVVDPSGEVIADFQNRLKMFNSDLNPKTVFKKGEAYFGQGEYIIAVRMCVSAIEAQLKIVFKNKGLKYPKDKNDKNMRIKDYMGKFEQYVNENKMITDGASFFPQVRSAVQLRHDIEHESLYHIPYSKIEDALAVLRRYFELLEK